MLGRITNLPKDRLILLALGVHLVTAWFSIGYHQCDELFQVYEFAGYKLGLNSISEMPWEFGEKMRSGLQPLIVFWTTKLYQSYDVHDPFIVSLTLRLLQSILSFIALVMLLQHFEDDIKEEKLKRVLWPLGLLFWCLPYFHARFSAENFSATLFLFGAVILIRYNKRAWPYFLGGLLLGLSFHARFQTAFMIAGLVAWLYFIQKIPMKQLGLAGAGFALALLIGLYVDRWMYDGFTFSPWNYLNLNLFQDKASVYGTEPWDFYFYQAALQLIPPFSIFILIGLVWFWIKFPKHVLSFITIPFIVLHLFVGHKELRFLFPVLNFIPLIFLFLLQSLNDRYWFYRLSFNDDITGLFKFSSFALILFFGLKPADDTSNCLKQLYAITGTRPATLLSREKNPYNDLASLHYFRNPNLKVITMLDIVHLPLEEQPLYFYSEKLATTDVILLDSTVFTKEYCNFPPWIHVLNFNGWVDRANVFSIYKVR